jgi:hypothetical protein
MIMSLYGKQLGPKTACIGRPDPQRAETPNPLRKNQTTLERQVFPSRLCDTEVKVGGIAAGLLYVQSGQINFKVPQQISIHGTTTVQVIYKDRSGPAVIQTLGAGPVTESAERLTDQIWTALHKVRWESPYRQPERASADRCEAIAPHPDLRSGLYGYEFYCAMPSAGAIAESFFFPASGTPPASLLRRADFRLANPYPAMSGEVEQLLKVRLTGSYGTGAIPERMPEIGMGGSEPGLSWNDGETTIFLGHNRSYVDPAGIREGVLLVAVRRQVLTERNLKRDLENAFSSSTQLAQSVIEADLAKDLGGFYLAAAKKPRTEPERAEAEHEVMAALLGLLHQSQEGDREIRAAKLVAADDLTVRLGSLLIVRSVSKGSEVLTEATNTATVRRELARFNIQYTGPGHYSGDLEYDRTLLQHAWKEFPETPWGQRAHLMLQRLSCSVSTGFPGPEQFKAVIQQGERFLQTYPDSPFRKEQLYHVALAYETWWSLSQAVPGDPTAEGARVDRTSAERARVKAIGLYEELFRLAPTSAEARAGQMVLPRLKLRFATGERSFFCFYD